MKQVLIVACALPQVDKPMWSDHPDPQSRIDAAQKAIHDLPQ